MLNVWYNSDKDDGEPDRLRPGAECTCVSCRTARVSVSTIRPIARVGACLYSRSWNIFLRFSLSSLSLASLFPWASLSQRGSFSLISLRVLLSRLLSRSAGNTFTALARLCKKKKESNNKTFTCLCCTARFSLGNIRISACAGDGLTRSWFPL